MKTLIKITVLTTLLIGVSACGWLTGDDGIFRDRSHDYRQARESAPLRLPEGVESETIDDGYAIPDISDSVSLSEEFIVPRPEALDDQVERDAVRINRLGGDQWVLVSSSPGQVWPRLRSFFNLGGVSLSRADAVNGLLETSWIQPVDEQLPKERYRLSIVQGVQRGSSEVSVLQMAISAGTSWPEASSSQKRENALVTQLSQFLADSAIEGSVSMLAERAIDASGRVTLEQKKDRQPYLILKLPFHRAWASLGLALRKANYITDDLDATQRVYYVSYVDQDEDQDEGWISGWFGRDDDDAPVGNAYLVRMKENDNQQVEITIELASGEALPEGEADKMLKLIKRQLS